MYSTLAAVNLALLNPAPSSETIRHAVFELGRDGARTLVAEGTREYSPDTDVRVGHAGTRSVRALLLFEAFELQIRFLRNHTVDGFDLAIKKRRSIRDFSFNWFDRQAGDIFVNAKVPARIRVLLTIHDGFAEPSVLEFLDDVTLRYGEHGPRDDSHEFVIQKGSVLRMHRAPQEEAGLLPPQT